MIEHTVTRYHPRFAYYSQDAVIGVSLRNYGEYAEIEVGLLLDVIRKIDAPTRVVYDIGANIGYHATAFASADRAQVHSFEPNPLNYAMLRENTNHLRNVTLHRMAIADRNGETLVETFDPAVSTNFGEIHIEQSSGIPVPCARIDDLHLPPPVMLKVDVEGFEWEVLSGAAATLARYRPVVYYEAQTLRNFDKIWHLLTDLGYTLNWCCIMNYNPNNHRANTNNIFSNSAIFNIMGWPPGWPAMSIGDPVLGPDDDWQRLCG